MGMVMLMVVVIMVMMVVVVGMVILWSHWLKSAKEFAVVTCEGTICKPRTQEMNLGADSWDTWMAMTVLECLKMIFKIFIFLNYFLYIILDCFDFNL
jgi:flagellar biosynthesis protein FlhB